MLTSKKLNTTYYFILAKTIALLFLGMVSLDSNAQSISSTSLPGVMSNSIRYGYAMNIIEGKLTGDSTLTRVDKFNSKSYQFYSAHYTNDTIDRLLITEYANDTVLLSISSFRDDKNTLDSKVEMKRDKNGNLIKVNEVFGPHPKGYKQKSKYNKKGLLTKKTTSYRGKTIRKIKYKYDNTGNLIEKTSCVPYQQKFILKYDSFGKHTHTHELVKGSGKKLTFYSDYSTPSVHTFHELNTHKRVNSLNGPYILSTKDRLTTEKRYDEQCRLVKETQFLNGNLFAQVSYYYSSL